MKKLTFLSLFILLISYGCGGTKKTTEKQEKTTQKIKETTNDKPLPNTKSNKDLDYTTVKYISRFQKIAKREMKEYGIPVSITLAQGILESQAGQSRLAKEANNHFGIKCHNDWRGKTIFHDDNKAQECFRKYDDPEQSYKDHSRFLVQRKRYAFLFRLPKTDYEAWARGLKKAGYATDPTYPEKLIYIIEKYNLNKIDKEVLRNMSVKVKEEENTENKKKKFIYEVQDGETLFTISRKFNIPVKDIQRINNLNEFDIYQGQILVLTEKNNTNNSSTTDKIEKTISEKNITSQPTIENNKIEKTYVDTNKYTLHTVKQSETLFSISKKYHISTDEIKKINRLSNNEINVGDILKIPLKKDILEKSKEKITNKVEEKITTTKQKDNTIYHTVKPGETLYRIHINYGVPIEKLRKLNHLKGNYIKVGQKLRIK